MKYLLPLVIVAAGLTFESTSRADSKDGPRSWTRTVKQQTEVIYKITFLADKTPGKQFAEFAVIGDGSTDVDILVYDAEGKQVAADTNYTDLALVRWTPNKTQEYTIKVRNLGKADNKCTMGHN
jgi:hypothetical protein